MGVRFTDRDFGRLDLEGDLANVELTRCQRESVADLRYRALDLTGTAWRVALDQLLMFDRDDVVLVAPKRSRQFRRCVEAIHLLREHRIAAQD